MASRQWLVGCWGGTLERDRWELRDLAPAEALEILEASFPERLQVRIEAYRWHRRMESRNTKASAAVDAMLEERGDPVKHFRFPKGHPGGPGRGHRGPIAILAAELGVSRSTAWRRLKAS